MTRSIELARGHEESDASAVNITIHYINDERGTVAGDDVSIG